MRRAALTTGILAAVCIGASPSAATAAGGTLVSSANPSTVGQAVTFTATFSFYCADGVAAKSFSVDGSAHPPSSFEIGGTSAVATLTTSSLRVGTHTVTFTWSTSNFSGATCGDTYTLVQTVRAVPQPKPRSPSPPAPSPTQPPVPTPSPSDAPVQPSPTPAAASTARLGLDASTGPAPGFRLALAVLVAVAIVTAATIAYRRRRLAAVWRNGPDQRKLRR